VLVLDTDFFRNWMTRTAALVDREADRLTELDSAIGDADHGGNLRRGFTAVAEELGGSPAGDPPAGPGPLLIAAGRRLISTVGGASGPLYGTLLRGTGKALGDEPEVSREQLARALAAGVGDVARLGGAKAGDKTMLDALEPGATALGGPDGSFPAARTAALAGAVGTVPMRARKGRASYLGERSIGHEDPGAASSALLFAALAETAGAAGGDGTDARDGTEAVNG
jgi:phosphoenolpyruvate---glycerone phosphotransferase subunit DhaL